MLASIFSGCSSKATYSTLEEAVKNNISSHQIEILNVCNETNLVLCYNKHHYILGGYNYNNGNYDNFKLINKIDTCNYEIVVETEYIKEVGNVIWGILNTEEQVEKFIIEYLNGDTVQVTAINNTFIAFMPDSLQDTDPNKLRTKILNVYAVNESNNILGKLKTYNIADPIIVMAD